MTHFLVLLLAGCYAPLWGVDPADTADPESAEVGARDDEALPPLPEPCVTLRRLQLVEQPPHALSVSLQVVECDAGDGIPPLPAAAFRVVNDQTALPFDTRDEGAVAFGQGPPLEIPAFTVIALDLSQSIWDAGAVDAVFDAASAVVDPLLPTDGRDVQHEIALYTFGAPSVSGPPTEPLRNPEDVRDELDLRRIQAANLGSTDLYQAHRDVVTYAASQSPDVRDARRHVVIISDGTHEAGNAAALRDQALALRREYIDEVDVYVVMVRSNARSVTRLCELADNTRQCLGAEDLPTLASTFTNVDERLGWLQRSIYSFGICTPVVLGQPSVTIDVTAEGTEASATLPYRTDDLDGSVQDCVAEDYLPARLPAWIP